MELIKDKPKGRYVSVLADGRLHETVSKDTEGAELREYETPDGKKGEKYELVYSELRGVISKVGFWDGDFGEMVQLTFSENGDQITLSQGVAGNFGEDILKKLPSLDPKKEVRIRPYAFEDEDTGKMKRGVTFWQNEQKVPDFFWDGKKKLHGFPEPEGDTSSYSKDEWKMYFLKCRVFLVKYIKENVMGKYDGEIEYEPAEGIKRPEEKSEDFADPF